jgi:hypothetical protein
MTQSRWTESDLTYYVTKPRAKDGPTRSKTKRYSAAVLRKNAWQQRHVRIQPEPGKQGILKTQLVECRSWNAISLSSWSISII